MAQERLDQEKGGRILRLEKSLVVSKQQCAQWKAQVAQLRQRCSQLEEENRALKEKLGTNSGNSSKPPSQDPFRRSRSSRPTGRKPGGQFGHPGHARTLYPESEVTRKIDLRPEECPDCHSKIFEESIISTRVHQVVDMPDMPPDVTQYQAHTLKCAHCGKQVQAQLPQYSFGPNLQTFMTTQMVESRRERFTQTRLVGEWRERGVIYGWERRQIAPFFALTPLVPLRPISAFLDHLKGH